MLKLRSTFRASTCLTRLWSQRRFYNQNLTPVKILVTGAAGQIGYSVLQPIARGDCFGRETPVEIHLLDIEATKNIMEGIRMELEDCAYDCLVNVRVFTDAAAALKDVDYAMMLANKMQLTANTPRIEIFASNKELYVEMGQLFAEHAKPDAKVLMVANPANTNCLVMMQNAKGRDPKCFTSLSRLDHNRLGRILADRLGVSVNNVRKYTVWGNHAASMHPDFRFAEYLKDNSPFSQPTPVREVLTFDEWNKSGYSEKVKDRAYEVIRARQKSSALSAGSAAVDHIRDWHCGTEQGHWVSMGVLSDGKKYDIPPGIVYSMPCVCYDGKYVVVDDLPIDDYTRECMKITADDLLEEKKIAGL